MVKIEGGGVFVRDVIDGVGGNADNVEMMWRCIRGF
jgi:hypothetical protein